MQLLNQKRVDQVVKDTDSSWNSFLKATPAKYPVKRHVNKTRTVSMPKTMKCAS